jgi:hypothetical protein
MSDEQLHLEVTYWEPGDGHGTPHRRVDHPPAPRFPSVFAGIDDPTPAAADPRHRACDDCREAFIPVNPEQRRCTRHQLAYDARQARRQQLLAGPDLQVDDVIR